MTDVAGIPCISSKDYDWNELRTTDGQVHGLMIKEEFCHLFLAEPDQRKTYEIRKNNVSFLKPGDKIALLAISSRSIHWKIVCILEFKGSKKIYNSEFSEYSDLHRLTEQAYKDMFNWASQGFCWAWIFEPVASFENTVRLPIERGCQVWRRFPTSDIIHDCELRSVDSQTTVPITESLSFESLKNTPTHPMKKSDSGSTDLGQSLVDAIQHPQNNPELEQLVNQCMDPASNITVTAIVLSETEWNDILHQKTSAIVRPFQTQHTLLYALLKKLDGYYWAGILTLQGCKEETQGQILSETCYTKNQLRSMKQFFLWRFNDIQCLHEASRTRLIRSTFCNRTFNIPLCHLHAPVVPPAKLDLRDTCWYFVDLCEERFRSSLLQQITKLDGHSIRVGTACSGSDICVTTLIQSLEYLNQRQDRGAKRVVGEQLECLYNWHNWLLDCCTPLSPIFKHLMILILFNATYIYICVRDVDKSKPMYIYIYTNIKSVNS